MVNNQQLTHFTFTIERRLDAPPAAVFKAWSDVEAKARWFAGAQTWSQTKRKFDFRVGGEERLGGEWRNGTTTEFVALYRDIVPNERIVYVYDMFVNGQKISVSLATIEVAPDGSGAIMKVTEQGAHFDGVEGGKSREHGTKVLIDRLIETLATSSGGGE